VDRLEWRARKYYEIPLLVLAHVMDPTTKGVGLKTGCDDLSSWATIMEFVIHYGQLFLVMTLGALLTTLPVKIQLAALWITCQEMC
jgi:hypothetical protein